VQLLMSNQGAAGSTLSVTIVDNAYGLGGPWHYSLAAGQQTIFALPTASTGNWYDLSLVIDTAANLQARASTPQAQQPKIGATMQMPTLQLQPYLRRFMGRMETGVDTISDPAMAVAGPHLSRSGRDPLLDEAHPLLPETHTLFRVDRQPDPHGHPLPQQPVSKNDHKDSRFYSPEDLKTEL
jgi:hypothetical protein